jgi:hypothetical protein
LVGVVLAWFVKLIDTVELEFQIRSWNPAGTPVAEIPTRVEPPEFGVSTRQFVVPPTYPEGAKLSVDPTDSVAFT